MNALTKGECGMVNKYRVTTYLLEDVNIVSMCGCH